MVMTSASHRFLRSARKALRPARQNIANVLLPAGSFPGHQSCPAAGIRGAKYAFLWDYGLQNIFATDCIKAQRIYVSLPYRVSGHLNMHQFNLLCYRARVFPTLEKNSLYAQ